MIYSRTRAEVSLLTKDFDLFTVMLSQKYSLLKLHTFCSSLSGHKQFLKFQVIDLELMLHVVD